MGITDTNCCMTFSKVQIGWVVICATDPFRCLKDNRMIINKFYNRC